MKLARIFLVFAVMPVLFVRPAWSQTADADESAIKAAALDYGDGFYSGAAERMERAIHPDLNKAVVVKINPEAKSALSYSAFSELVELTRAKVGFLEEAKRKITVTVLDRQGEFACARLQSALFDDYLALVKADNAWKIVNVLWASGPDSPRRMTLPVFNPDSTRETVRKTVLDMVEGIYSGDLARFEKAVHPEISVARWQVLPPTGRGCINRRTFCLMSEIVKAKLVKPAADVPPPVVKVLDMMDGMAFVRADYSNTLFYIQAAWVDGTWKIVNVLTAPSPQASK